MTQLFPKGISRAQKGTSRHNHRLPLVSSVRQAKNSKVAVPKSGCDKMSHSVAGRNDCLKSGGSGGGEKCSALFPRLPGSVGRERKVIPGPIAPAARSSFSNHPHGLSGPGVSKKCSHFASAKKNYKKLEVLPFSGNFSTTIWIRPDARKTFLQKLQRILVHGKTYFSEILFLSLPKLFYKKFTESPFCEKSPTNISRISGSGKSSPQKNKSFPALRRRDLYEILFFGSRKTFLHVNKIFLSVPKSAMTRTCAFWTFSAVGNSGFGKKTKNARPCQKPVGQERANFLKTVEIQQNIRVGEGKKSVRHCFRPNLTLRVRRPPEDFRPSPFSVHFLNLVTITPRSFPRCAKMTRIAIHASK